MKRQQCFHIEVLACKHAKCVWSSEEKISFFLSSLIFLNKPLFTFTATLCHPGRMALEDGHRPQDLPGMCPPVAVAQAKHSRSAVFNLCWRGKRFLFFNLPWK